MNLFYEKKTFSMETHETQHCRRCGTCCEKGGPTLHREDLPLVESGKIPLAALFTIRKGEMVLEPMQETPVPAAEELIKIQGTGETWCCRYLEAESKACGIYDDRPQECRAQKCWDDTEIRAVYSVDRLSRKDILAGTPELWELVQEHERRCSYQRLGELAENLAGNSENDTAELTQMVGYDLHLRDLVCSRGKMDPAIMDFLFGRPMPETVHGFGLKAETNGDRIILIPDIS